MRTGTMSKATDINLAPVLAAGATQDVVLLRWAGKMLPKPLQPLHRDTLVALQAARGLVRDSSMSAAAKLDFARRLERLANGNGTADVPAEWRTVVCASPSIAAMTASLLQAAQRELSLTARGERILFAGWSDFYNHARFSLVPVGRALLDGAGITNAAANEAMDASMIAVALIAALQEAPQRYRQSGGVNLPMQWLVGENLEAKAFGQLRSSKPLRQVFDRGVNRAQELLAIAGPTRGLGDLGRYGSAIGLLTRRLLHRLRRHDPLVRPIALGLLDQLALRLTRLN